MTIQRFNAGELREYWRELASGAEHCEHDADLLAVVCGVGGPLWYNRYFARFQRKAFLRAIAHCGRLDQKTVLEVGCGGGRWSRLLRDRGAAVTAVDVSPVVITRNRKLISGVEFVCADILDLDVGSRQFDVAVSVTVLQHLPFKEQEVAAQKLAGNLRTDGYLVLLENTSDQDRHVFSRRAPEWVSLFREAGFRPIYLKGYGYDLPLRWWATVARAIRWSNRRRRLDAVSGPGELARSREAASRQGARRLYHSLVIRPLVGVSYLTEPLCQAAFSNRWATHAAMVFRKQ